MNQKNTPSKQQSLCIIFVVSALVTAERYTNKSKQPLAIKAEQTKQLDTLQRQ